jgi:hypothetical protein
MQWIQGAIQKFPKFEIPLSISPHILLKSVWQAASSWVIGFIVGERISIVLFSWLHSFAMADLREQLSV